VVNAEDLHQVLLRGTKLLEVHHIYGGDALVVADDQLRTVCRKRNPRVWLGGMGVTTQ
jgi:hypothetical protein